MAWGYSSSWTTEGKKYVSFNTPELNPEIPTDLMLSYENNKLILFNEIVLFVIKEGIL